jgi:Zn-dependent protease with chaperone function
LYGLSFALHAACALLRSLAVFALAWLVLALTGSSTGPAALLAWLAGGGPLVLSLATLVYPWGGWWWQQSKGGRSPSRRERLLYEDALRALRRARLDFAEPARWFVLDVPYANAAVYGNALMVTRGLLECPELQAVLAHELGHLNSLDGRLTAAVVRLSTPPRRRLWFPFKTIGLLVSGGAAVWVMLLPWAAYWRRREYEADRFAASLGEAEPLMRFLEDGALQRDLPVPFPWLTERDHPSTEHRIDRLIGEGSHEADI